MGYLMCLALPSCRGIVVVTIAFIHKSGLTMPLSCFLRFFALFLLLPATVLAVPAVPPAAPTGVCSAIVYDLENDAILFEQNADERIPPASLTKVMSMFLAMDYISGGHASMADNVEISPLSAGQSGSRMGLRAYERVTLNKLLLGMAVSSGNDASYAVAEYVGGSAEAFVKMMNTRAAVLGMADTSFANPHGLPHPKQYTTARDMLTLARAYLRAHPNALSFHSTRVLEHDGYKSWNKNPLIGQYPGADGLKSGWIRASGYNLIFTASRGKQRLLAVIMGAPDTAIRGAEACRLLDAGFMVCDNTAVTVTAALDSLPLDLNRIDPRKTARDAGIFRAKRVAKAHAARKSYKTGIKSNRRHLKASPKAAKSLLAKKNGSVHQQRKTAAKHKAHAERRAPRAKRG